MKLVFEPFIHEMNTGALWLDFLFPCHDNHTLYTTGVYRSEYDYRMEDWDLKQIIVAVWDKNHDWDYFIEDIKEYLLVEIVSLGPGKFAKYSLEARIIKKIPKTEIIIRQDDYFIELDLSAIGIFKYKKL